jgi:hypothetical protein
VSEPEQPPSWQPSYQQAPPGQPYQQPAPAAWPPPGQPYQQPPASWPPPGQPYPPPPPPPWPSAYQAAPPNPYAYPPASRYTYAPPSHRGRNVIIGSIVATLVVTVAVVGITGAQSSTTHGSSTTGTPIGHSSSAASNPPGSAGGLTATSPLNLAKSTPVFADDFTDPDSGWATGTDADSTYAYTPAGYSMESHVSAHFLSYAPYDVPAPQVSMSITGTLVTGAALGSGIGVICHLGPDSASQLRYEFVVSNAGKWFVERNQGDFSTSAEPTVLNEGITAVVPGENAITVSGVCATLADGTTTRLALFINGVKVVDMLNVATLDDAPWLGGILTTNGSDDPTTAIISEYDESTLGPMPVLAANT